MPDSSLSNLQKDIEDATEKYENIIGFPAIRTRQLPEQYGYIEALSRIVVSGEIQQGFRILRNSNQLDLTFEAIVIRHKNMFRNDIVEAAIFRIENAHHLD